MKKFNEVIKDERIELRLLKPTFEMAEIIFKAIEEGRAFLIPWISLAKIENSGSIESVFNYLISKKNDLDYGVFVNNELVGSVGIFDISEKTKMGKLRYWLKKSAVGNGYINDGIIAIQNEFFKEKGLAKIIAYVDDKNKTSVNVLEKQKFFIEKTEEYKKTKNQIGLYLVYAKLKSDWDETNEK